jgi:predicted lipoprotein with Yx(FWY)xxD motif
MPHGHRSAIVAGKADPSGVGRQQGGTNVRTWNTTKGLQDPHHGGSQPTTPADLLAAAPTRPGSRPRRLRWRRPLLALVALTAAAALAAGCGTSGSGSGSGSGGGGGIYGGAAPSGTTPSGTTPSGTTPSGVATVATASNSLGTILVDGGGRTLYLFEKDQPNRSACSGACVAAWPVDPTSGTPKAGSGVQASLLGTITRADGSTQVTYNRHPLYYFARDSGPGQQGGQGIDAFGAKWFVVTPAGSATGA